MGLAEFFLMAAALLLASTLQAATGFGLAILAVPVLFVLVSSTIVVPVIAALSFLVSLVLIPGLWSLASRRSLYHLAGGSCLGFPVGLGAFMYGSLDELKLVSGIVVTTFAGILILSEWRGSEDTGTFANTPLPAVEWGVGAVSGAMATALAMPGPAIMIYLMFRRAPKHIARAITLSLFGLSYAVATGLHVLYGGLTVSFWWTVAALTPAVLLGTGAGHVLARLIPEDRFRRAVIMLLVLSGLSAVLAAIYG